MRAQFVDRREPHHAFGHLRLDRTVGIQRIGHAIDDARFEHRDLRRVVISRPPAGNDPRYQRRHPLRRRSTACGRRAAAAESRSANVPASARRRRTTRAALPAIREPAARLRVRDEEGSSKDPFAPGRARAPCVRTMRTTNCASAWPPARARRWRAPAGYRPARARGGLPPHAMAAARTPMTAPPVPFGQHFPLRPGRD